MENSLVPEGDGQGGKLTVADLGKALSYDPATGTFMWLVSFSNRAKVGSRAGTMAGGCRQIQIHGVLYKEHRLAWLLHHGVWPTGVIDHANGDPLDNRIENLRDTNQTMNNANQKIRSNNTSGFKGVYFNKRRLRWDAYVKNSGHRTYLGSFDTAEDAHLAYCAAAEREFGEYARYH